MMNRKRVLLLSASMILLCMCVIVGATYALFTDSVTVKNHLMAGNLDLKFERTNLEFTVLNNDGLMVKHVYRDDVDFTEIDTSNGNIFGITNDDKIVPGSYVKADLKISHDRDGDVDITNGNGDSNVAFNYQVYISLTGGNDTDLADQLYVTVTDKNGNVVNNIENVVLSDNMFNVASSDYICVLQRNNVILSQADEFTVKVEFKNVLDNGATNNLAQNEKVSFDLIVEAQQSTATPVETVTH